MRGFQEIRGHTVRIVYDRARADFVAKVEPHLFVNKPKIEARPRHNGANGKVSAGKDKC
jgi:hypothetical protein